MSLVKLNNFFDSGCKLQNISVLNYFREKNWAKMPKKPTNFFFFNSKPDILIIKNLFHLKPKRNPQ